MILYKVDHIYDRVKYSNVNLKNIGYFDSLAKAEQAIKQYKLLEGFKEYPNGFIITAIKIDKIRMPRFVYELILYVHDSDYDYEYERWLSVHTSREMAETSRKRFEELNRCSLYKSSLNIELMVDQIPLNEPSAFWSEGFTVSVRGGK